MLQSGFYLTGLLVFLVSISDGRIAFYEAAVIISGEWIIYEHIFCRSLFCRLRKKHWHKLTILLFILCNVYAVYFTYTCTVAVMYLNNNTAGEITATQNNNNAQEYNLGQKSQTINRSSSVDSIESTNYNIIVNNDQSSSTTQSPSPTTNGRSCYFFPTVGRTRSDVIKRKLSKTKSADVDNSKYDTSLVNDNNRNHNTNNKSTNIIVLDNEARFPWASDMEEIDAMQSDKDREEDVIHDVDELDFESTPFISEDIESVGGVQLSSAYTYAGNSGSNNNINNNNNINTSSGLYGGSDGANSGAQVENENSEVFHQFMRLVMCIYSPTQRLCRAILPSLHPQIPNFIFGNSGHGSTTNTIHHHVICSSKVPLSRAILVLLSSILAIGVLATCIVTFCEAIIAQLGFSSTAMGATLVAFGAEVSD